MKANLRKMLGLAALGMTLLTNTVPTWAGAVANVQVGIYRTNNIFDAYGVLTTARYSADSRQYIGCRVSAYANGSRSATCAAQPRTDDIAYCSTSDPNLIEKIQKMTDSSKDKIGRRVYCSSSDPKFIAAVNAMTDSSYISFRMAPGTTQCSELIVNNSSPNLG